MTHNAAALVNLYRLKMRSIYDLWVDTREGIEIPLEVLKGVYGQEAHAYQQLNL